MSRILVVMGLIVLAGCGTELSTEHLFDQEEVLAIYYNPEKKKLPPLEEAVTISRRSEPFERLVAWFDTHNEAWKYDDVQSYNQVMSIRGSELQIDIHDTFIRIGFNNKKGHFRQYWTSCDLSDFEFLLERNK